MRRKKLIPILKVVYLQTLRDWCKFRSSNHEVLDQESCITIHCIRECTCTRWFPYVSLKKGYDWCVITSE